MRTLAIAALSYSAAVFAACYLLPIGALPAAALGLAAVGAELLLPRRKWLRAFVLAFFAAAFGFLLFFVHAQRTTVPAARLDGTSCVIQAQVLDYPIVYEAYSRLEIRLETEGLPRVDAIFYDNSGALSEAEPGTRFSCEARLRTASRRYGEKYLAYNARDLYLIASSRAQAEITGESRSARFWPVRLNRLVSDRVRELFPEDTAAFYQALLLGDKAELYQNKGLQLAMSRAGLMHVVAVSGMHVAFLVGLMQTVFGRTRRSSLCAIVLVWLFVLVTGAGPSAMRAGIMQTLLLLAPLFGRENDPLTSLSAALGLILLWNPYAAAGVSLQLSFASIAGIYCFAGRMSESLYERWPDLRSHALGRAAAGAVVNSLSVLPFTVPLMAGSFGYVALLSPLSNLLCLPLVPLCFSGSFITCALSLVSRTAAKLLAWLLAWPARFVILVCRAISALPFAALYRECRGALGWLILVYGLFLGFRLLRRRPRLRLAIPALLSAASLAALLVTTRLEYQNGPGTMAAIDVGQGQSLCVMAGEQTLMIDCGGTGTLRNAGESAGRYLLSRGRRQVDALLLTHLDEDHCNGVMTLMEYCPVRQLIFLADADNGNGMYEQLLQAAEEHGTQLVLLQQDSALTLGELYAELYVPPERAQGNDHCLCCVVSLGEEQMLVTGDISQNAEKALLQRYPLRDLELLVVGHHGAKNAASSRLLRAIGADRAVISCGYNSYGHPAPETLERLAACGYSVYRTDENGTFEIRVG